MKTMIHDPDANLDYAYDWSDWLDTDETITDYTVTPPAGITLGTGTKAPAEDAGIVTVWLSGGTTGQIYDVVCHIVTSAGREDDRTIRLLINDR